MGDLAKSFDKLDSIIATITKDNVAGKMKELVDEGSNINTFLKSSASKIQASKPLNGILGALPLVSKAAPLVKSLNQTLRDAAAKLSIVQEAKLTDKVVDGFKNAEPGIAAVTVAIVKNVAPLIQSLAPAPKAGAAPSPGGSGGGGGAAALLGNLGSITEKQVTDLLDPVFEAMKGLLDGSVDFASIAKGFKDKAGAAGAPGGAGATLTSGGAPAAPKAAAPPPAAAPPAASPKAKSPKGKSNYADEMVAQEWTA